MTAINLSKQQALDAHPKSIQQVNFTGILNRQNAEGQNINVHTTMFFIIEEVKGSTLDFSQGILKVL